MRGIPTKKLLGGALVLLAFGAVRLPVERAVEQRLVEEEFIYQRVGLGMMEKLGQGGFAAALGGFRPLIANFYYIKAYVDAMEKEEWGRVDQTYGLITTLQPRNAYYWDNYVWHIGWNAYAWANAEADYLERKGEDWKASNLRDFAARDFLNRAEEIGHKGARIAPAGLPPLPAHRPALQREVQRRMRRGGMVQAWLGGARRAEVHGQHLRHPPLALPRGGGGGLPADRGALLEPTPAQTHPDRLHSDGEARGHAGAAPARREGRR